MRRSSLIPVKQIIVDDDDKISFRIQTPKTKGKITAHINHTDFLHNRIQTPEFLLSNPLCRSFLMVFSEAQYNSENIKFVLEVETLRCAVDNQQSKYQSYLCLTIYFWFIGFVDFCC